MKILFLILITLFAQGAICTSIKHCDDIRNETETDSSNEYEFITEPLEDLDRLATFKASFYLYTKENPLFGEKINCKKESSMEQVDLKETHETRFLIHDWSDSYKSEMNTVITKALLARGSYNVIAVDWPEARNTNYAQARISVRWAGKKVAKMIKCLSEKYNMSMSTLHVIGHGLGAHVAGKAGQLMKKQKINTIIGLDPAAHLFPCDDPFIRLSSKNADYVEVVHTNGAFFGFLRPIGTADFYVNGGMSQKSCTGFYRNECSHKKAYTYYAEAITLRNFGALKCHEYSRAISKRCGGDGPNVLLGSPKNRHDARGAYYVPVFSKSPFGIPDPTTGSAEEFYP